MATEADILNLGDSIALELTRAENSINPLWKTILFMGQIRTHMSRGLARGIISGLDTAWQDVQPVGGGDPRRPVLSPGWVNFGLNYAPAAFRQTLSGGGELRGSVMQGAVGTPIMTLPAALYPTQNLKFATLARVGTAWAPATIEVWIDGQVIFSYSELNGSDEVLLSGLTWETL